MNTNLYEKIVNENGEVIFRPYDISKIKICGRTVSEIIQILNGLDLEKEKELTLTMNNLGKWIDLVKKDIEETQREAIRQYLEENKWIH